ncbi:hypothetical protein TWF281_006279 [Arthrobotrys megalospora]
MWLVSFFYLFVAIHPLCIYAVPPGSSPKNKYSNTLEYEPWSEPQPEPRARTITISKDDWNEFWQAELRIVNAIGLQIDSLHDLINEDGICRIGSYSKPGTYTGSLLWISDAVDEAVMNMGAVIDLIRSNSQPLLANSALYQFRSLQMAEVIMEGIEAFAEALQIMVEKYGDYKKYILDTPGKEYPTATAGVPNLSGLLMAIFSATQNPQTENYIVPKNGRERFLSRWRGMWGRLRSDRMLTLGVLIPFTEQPWMKTAAAQRLLFGFVGPGTSLPDRTWESLAKGLRDWINCWGGPVYSVADMTAHLLGSPPDKSRPQWLVAIGDEPEDPGDSKEQVMIDNLGLILKARKSRRGNLPFEQIFDTDRQ